jgi:hypothetical protein
MGGGHPTCLHMERAAEKNCAYPMIFGVNRQGFFILHVPRYYFHIEDGTALCDNEGVRTFRDPSRPGRKPRGP